MILKIETQGATLTKGMKAVLEEKLKFLEEIVKEQNVVKAKVIVEKNIQRLIISFYLDNSYIKLEEKSNDFYENVEVLVHKLKKYVLKRRDVKQQKMKRKFSYYENKKRKTANTGSKIIKEELFIDTMFEEEAILQMKLLNKQCFMFCNANLNYAVCMMYRIKDEKYGLIISSN